MIPREKIATKRQRFPVWLTNWTKLANRKISWPAKTRHWAVNSDFPSFTYFLTTFPLLDENAELKSQYSEFNRRFHELEIKYRRLENEREELASAYKEIQRLYVYRRQMNWIIWSTTTSFCNIQAGKGGRTQRAQRMAAEMNQYRHDMERRLGGRARIYQVIISVLALK